MRVERRGREDSMFCPSQSTRDALEQLQSGPERIADVGWQRGMQH